VNNKARTKLAVWHNEKRESDKHPHVKASKPVEIAGRRYWLSGWFSCGGPQDDTAVMESRVEKFLEALAAENGTFPILKLELEEADAQQGGGASQSQAMPELPDDDCPF